MLRWQPIPPLQMLITLTTDFGYHDAFVGIMKGVIFAINPQAQVIDLSHGIPAQDIMAGALTLRHAIGYFPRGTIHVAVVDPGVGTPRRPLLIESDGSYFIGPDNGIFSLDVGRQNSDSDHGNIEPELIVSGRPVRLFTAGISLPPPRPISASALSRTVSGQQWNPWSS